MPKRVVMINLKSPRKRCLPVLSAIGILQIRRSRVDQTFDWRREETKTRRIESKDGGETLQKGHRRCKGKQDQRSPPTQGWEGNIFILGCLRVVWHPSTTKDMGKIKEEMKLKEAIKEAEAKKRGMYCIVVPAQAGLSCLFHWLSSNVRFQRK